MKKKILLGVAVLCLLSSMLVFASCGDEHACVFNETGYGYDYVKEIAITSGNSFVIRHSLRNTGSKTLKGDAYNHNFFTLGLYRPGPQERLIFPSGLTATGERSIPRLDLPTTEYGSAEY